MQSFLVFVQLTFVAVPFEGEGFYKLALLYLGFSQRNGVPSVTTHRYILRDTPLHGMILISE
jgi:hypothetical protein